jgi:hypothetical protein
MSQDIGCGFPGHRRGDFCLVAPVVAVEVDVVAAEDMAAGFADDGDGGGGDEDQYEVWTCADVSSR